MDKPIAVGDLVCVVGSCLMDDIADELGIEVDHA